MANNCFEALRKELPEEITDKDIKDFLKNAEDLKNSAPNFRTFRQMMIDKVTQERQNLAIYKQRVIMDQSKIRAAMKRMVDPKNYNGDALKALQTEATGANSAYSEKANRSMLSESEANRQQLGNPFLNALEKIPGANEKLQSHEVDLDTRKELWEMRKGGNPGLTKNPTAMETAKVFKALHDRIRTLSDAAGYPMGDIDGYMGPQSHEPARIAPDGIGTPKANETKAQWIKEVSKAFDIKGAENIPPEEKITILSKLHDDIVNGVYGKEGLAPGTGDDFVSGYDRGMGMKLGGSRTLTPKNPELLSGYLEKYGKGGLLDSAIDQIDNESRRIARNSQYGSTPGDTFKGLITRMQKQFPDQADKLESARPQLMHQFFTAAGMSERAGDNLGTKVTNNLMAVQTIAKLWKVTVKKLNEWPNATGLVSSALGKGWLETHADLTKQFFTLDKGDMSKLMLGYDPKKMSLIDEIKHVFQKDASIAGLIDPITGQAYEQKGMLTKASALTQRLNGMKAMTKQNYETTAKTAAHFWGMEAGTEFEKLNPSQLGNLTRYSIDKPTWDVIRQGSGQFEGRKIPAILSENITQTDPKVIQGIINENKLDTTPEKLMLTAQNKYINMLQYQAHTAVYHSNVATQVALRSFLGNPLSPNSPGGNLMKLAMQYKSVMFQMGHAEATVLKSNPNLPPNPSIWQAVKGGAADGHLMTKVIPTALMSAGLYAAGKTGLNKLEGKDAPNFHSMEFVKESFANSGALGIMSDPVAGYAAKNGENEVKWAVGPTLGEGYTLGDAAIKSLQGRGTARSFAHAATNIAEDLAPGQTIPYMKHAYNSLIFDHIHDLIDKMAGKDGEYIEKRDARIEKAKEKAMAQ